MYSVQCQCQPAIFLTSPWRFTTCCCYPHHANTTVDADNLLINCKTNPLHSST